MTEDPAAAARAAKAKRERERRARASEAAGRRRRTGDDRRIICVPVRLYGETDPVSFALSTPEVAALDTQVTRGRYDGRSEYVRELLLAEHRIEDAAQLDTAAAKAGVTRSQFIRDAVLAAREDD